MNKRVVYMAAALAVLLTVIALVWGGARTSAQGRRTGRSATSTTPPLYAVLIDAGSSGSRVHVYTYTINQHSTESRVQHRLRTHSAAAAAATRRQLNRVTGGGIGASDTPPPPTHGQNRDLGSGPAAQSSRHAHTTVRGTSTSNDAGAAAAAAGPRSSSGSSRGVPLLQRYPDVSLPGRVHRIQPGLSALAPAGEGAADYLEPLLQFARQQVPAELHAVTPVQLLATAGLRLLPEEQQQLVLAAAAAVLAGSGFLFVHPGQAQAQQQQQAQAQPNITAPLSILDRMHRRLFGSSTEGRHGSSGDGSSSDGSSGSSDAALEAGGGSDRVPAEELRAEAAVAAGSGAWVRVLSGDQEGLYAWAGINYAAGRLQALAAQAAVSPRQRDAAAWLGSQAAATLAVFELGGASMQVTLMPWEPLPGGLGHQLALPGVTRPLYTHSFLGYGLNVAWFRGAMLVADGGAGEAATDPCLNPGYTSQSSGVTGSGNFSGCVALAEQLLGLGVGQGAQGAGSNGCPHTRCSIGSEYLPSLLPLSNSSSGSSGASSGFLIMATEAFHYTISHLRLPPASSLDQLAAAGAAFCARPWSEVETELVQERGVEEDHALKLCFGAAYIHTMLSKGFRLSPQEAARLRFSNWVTRADGSQVEVNWVLGALLAEVVPEQLRRLGPSPTGQLHPGIPGAAGAAAAQQPSMVAGSGGGGAAGGASPRGLVAGGLVALVLVSGLLTCAVAAAGGEAGMAGVAGVAGGRGASYRSRRGGGPAAPGAGLTAALASVVVKVVDAGGGGGGGGGGGAGAGWAGRLGSMWGGAVDAAAYAAVDPAAAVAGVQAEAVASAGPGSSALGAATAAGGPSPSALSLLATLGLGPREGGHGGSSGAAAARAAQRRGASALLQASGLGAGGLAGWATGEVAAHCGAAGGGPEGVEALGAGAVDESMAVASGSTSGVAPGSLEQRRGTRAAVAML
ncbi:hypothetical protein CHLRE_07g330600v5 [Chlamydomonas reinhardtii]|uniref:Apyrase n=1 Tax=Chlamydomonas reinhardtii TaxID=3055 RepID=A0A2K3DJV4_CHLRE|nr:uncharacterized protein CHLRE_07g330600v5 [Chlamydomonas reinhardtii]PNW80812.1 hypothetical protein CHLRE_07g330600v5 [Chlamydomonas reinhardtii]